MFKCHFRLKRNYARNHRVSGGRPVAFPSRRGIQLKMFNSANILVSSSATDTTSRCSLHTVQVISVYQMSAIIYELSTLANDT